MRNRSPSFSIFLPLDGMNIPISRSSPCKSLYISSRNSSKSVSISVVNLTRGSSILSGSCAPFLGTTVPRNAHSFQTWQRDGSTWHGLLHGRSTDSCRGSCTRARRIHHSVFVWRVRGFSCTRLAESGACKLFRPFPSQRRFFLACTESAQESRVRFDTIFARNLTPYQRPLILIKSWR